MATELTIGEFSRIRDLSVKTLRHYHETGLLEPSSVNPGNGNLIDRPRTQLEIEYRSVPPARAIGIRAVVDREDVLAWWRGALGELHAMIPPQGLRRTGSTGGLYASGLYQHDRGETTVFIPVEGVARSVGRVESLVVPAAELAIATHRGSLADVDLTYGELGSYATRHELSVAGPLREYYVGDSPHTVDSGTWVTEIGWPIFRADAQR